MGARFGVETLPPLTAVAKVDRAISKARRVAAHTCDVQAEGWDFAEKLKPQIRDLTLYSR
jgi:hypothetical protein